MIPQSPTIHPPLTEAGLAGGESDPTKQHTPMSPKEALALFNVIRHAYLRSRLVDAHTIEDFQEQDRHWQHTWDAYLVLVRAVYGPCQGEQLPFPCDECQRRYAEHRVKRENDLLFTWYCTPCLTQLKETKGKLATIELNESELEEVGGKA